MTDTAPRGYVFDQAIIGFFPDDVFCYYKNKNGCEGAQVQLTVSQINPGTGWFACNFCAHYSNEDVNYQRIPRKPKEIVISGELDG